MVTTKSHRPTKSQVPTQRAAPPAPPWPTYTGTSRWVGTSSSGRVTVYVDPTLGQPGLQNAQALVNDADRVVAANDNLFGTPGGPVSVIIYALNGNTDGTGGADHAGCDYQTGAAIEVCAAFGSPARVSALFEAELSECSMGGNLCGVSTGEALSRWCAAVVSNDALADFASAPTWAQSGMPDYVNRTDPTDQNPVSTGCGMAFLSWLLSQGHDLAKIAQAMVSLGDSGTLAQLYASLSGAPASRAWGAFKAAVRQLPGGVTDDDPFGGTGQPSTPAQLTPATVPSAAACGCPTASHRLRKPLFGDLVPDPPPDHPFGPHHGSDPDPGVSRSLAMNPQYGPWGYNFAASYYYKVCHYYDSDNKPYIFFMIWHPSYPQYYYCYYPISPTAGFYWCRCYSPNHPQYNPFYFSRIPGIADTPPEQFGQLADQYPTIEAANPFFDNFDTMPAHYPPSFTLPMQPLPPGLPTG